jgi:CO/xanthine dehydrogenase Mo-binding subunit
VNEEYIYDKDENPGFLDYRVPVAPDVPMIDTVTVENVNPRHPSGARGVGEVADRAPMAAGRMRDLTMSPPRLPAAINKNSGPK